MGPSLPVLTTFWFELIDRRVYLNKGLHARISDHGLFLTFPDLQILDPLIVT